MPTYASDGCFPDLSTSGLCESKRKSDLPPIFKLNRRRTQSLWSAFVSSLKIRYSIQQFCPKTVATSPHIWFSRKFDLNTLTQHSWFFSRARIDGAYKRTSQKLQPVDLNLPDGSKPNESDAWRLDAIKREIRILDPTNKYTHWLIPKFTSIAKGARLTPKRLCKMIIEEGMTAQEKEVLIEMLYNRVAVLAWDFTEIGKVKREVAPPKKI